MSGCCGIRQDKCNNYNDGTMTKDLFRAMNIKRRITMALLRRWRWLRHRLLYVIADATDNSVTMSRALVDMIDPLSLDETKVMVFRTGGEYAFIVNPILECETHYADIQYNQKHRCVGFECLVPTVNRIFYDYGIKHLKVKLSVEPIECSDTLSKTKRYYILLRP